MLFGAHIFLWTDHWSDASLPLLDRAASLGLNALEIAVGDDITLNPAPLRRRAQSLNLDLVLSPGAGWPMHADISDDDPANRAFGLNWHKHWLDLAADAGAVAYTGAVYGHPGQVRRRIPPPDELPRTAENLHLLAQYASERNLKLVIEPMSHFRTHLVNTPEQAMRLIDLADHPNLAILLDTYHMITEVRDYSAAVRAAAPRLWGLHACENDRGAPGGGLVPWDALMAALRESSADCHIFMESYNSSIGDFAVARGMFHSICPDGDAFVRQGLAFLRACWGQMQPPTPHPTPRTRNQPFQT